jgi:hypothetical protein
MGQRFVIQPFDRGRYAKRYEDVFAPAIRDAGLEPYRVDRDPSVSIPIEDIQTGIESCEACLAEISTDNPNVWFELGYAIASQREVVLVCSDERASHFPFDVQHRSIIKYFAESPRDFEQLQAQITTRLKALLRKKEQLGQVAQISPVAKVEGLEQFGIAALVAVAQQISIPSDGIGAYSIREDMEKAGFTKLAATLGLTALLNKEILETFEAQEWNIDPYTAYRVTPKGMSWLFSNRDILALRQDDDDDDVPF